MTLAELAAHAHADATRRRIYPQDGINAVQDIVSEAIEVQEAWIDWDDSSQRPEDEGLFHHLAEELADVLITTLSVMHDLKIDPDSEVARKMCTNATRGRRKTTKEDR